MTFLNAKHHIVDYLKINVYSQITKKTLIKDAVYKGLVIFVLLVVLRPFGLSDSNIPFLILTIFAYSISISFVYLLGNLIIKYKLYKKKWVIYNELLFSIYVIIFSSLLNFGVSLLLNTDFNFIIEDYLRILIYSFLLISIMIIGWLLVIMVFHYRDEVTTLNVKYKYLQEIESFYNAVNKSNNEIIELNIEKKVLKVQRNQLVLVSSLGNYIRIFILNENESLIQIIKRDTLKNIEMQLNIYKEFFRCHRTHIVNLKYIENIKGTAKNTTTEVCKQSISISRQHVKKIKHYLAKREVN